MQAQYYLTAKSEKGFDVNLVTARLQQLPGAFRLPDPKDVVFVIAATPAMAKFLLAKVKMDPRTSMQTQGIITIHPRSIGVMQNVPPPILAQIEGFVTWMLKTYPCNVISEEGEDYTARYGKNPHALFVEEDSWH